MTTTRARECIFDIHIAHYIQTSDYSTGAFGTSFSQCTGIYILQSWACDGKPGANRRGTYKSTTNGRFPNLPVLRYIQAAFTNHPHPRFSPPHTLAQTMPSTPYTTTRAASTHAVGSRRSRNRPQKTETNRPSRARTRLVAQSRSHACCASSQ